MRENVGQIDRTARSVIGAALIARGIIQLIRGKELRGLLRLVGGSLLIETAMTRVCPLNATFGIDTRSSQEKLEDFRGDVNEQSARITADYGTKDAVPEVTTGPA